ncbi:hypothetical protein B0H14DRAFT_2585975 [Mycena olivaceomarginata]|nr:hypothetical protein B0H14DRAFT_2585975 [Mycena olivaceomarginata]
MSLLHEAPPPSYDPSEGLAVAADSEFTNILWVHLAIQTHDVDGASLLYASVSRHLDQRQAPKEFSYEIKNYSAKPWPTLTLLGHPILSTTTPTFIDRSGITGSTEAESPKPQIPSNQLLYSLILENPHKHSKNFPTAKAGLDTVNGDPRAPGTSDAGNTWTEKLKGNYELPFSINIPEGSIEYYLELRISRGKLRSDDRIMTPFGLFILRPPSPPSQLQQLAYRSNIRIPGPHSDPDGWHALEPVQVEGKLFGERTVNAKCTVFLAKPRCVRCTFGYSSTNVSPCGQAVWWPAPDAAMAHRQRRPAAHYGRNSPPEISTRRLLSTISVCGGCLPSHAAAFKPHSTGPLITQTVEIVTGHAEGVRAKTATIPPANESSDPFVERYYESVAGPKPRRPLSGP